MQIDEESKRAKPFICGLVAANNYYLYICTYGAKSVCGIAEWARSLDRRSLRCLGIKRRKPPSESAIRKFLTKVDAHSVDDLIGAWLLTQANTDRLEIAIDGKVLRGSRKEGKES